ncbi:MAG: type II toxin-antitoxin system RelB/DinJ family antitoxin [Defluviitaleaceae bacterium]|nr:type II toxin-antitoxin system RelB/DinJ family antitoxin [Defluviitaleaceae bacterium]
MAKTTSIYTRVEPEIKEQAEQVLLKLGVPMANAINMFLHQVVMHNGFPFAVKIQNKPLDLSMMTMNQLNAALEEGLADVKAGRITSAKQVREELLGMLES